MDSVEKKIDKIANAMSAMNAGFSEVKLELRQFRLDTDNALFEFRKDLTSLGADVRAIAYEHGNRLDALEEEVK